MSERKRKGKGQEKLHLIPQVPFYKYGHAPLLSDEKKISIQEKLQLQKQAVYNARNRESNLDYYIKYNFNPFMEYRGKDNILMQTYIKNNKAQVTNVVDKLTEMKIAQPPIKPRIQQTSLQFKQQKIAFSMFSDKILNNIQKQNSKANQIQRIKTYLQQKSLSLHRTKSSTNIQINSPKKQQKAQKVDQPQNKEPTQENIMNFSIQSIAAIKQQNHFLKNMKKINIFKIIKGQADEISSKQMLRKMHFCNSGTIQKIAKIKIPIYRDISTLGRTIILDKTTGAQNILDYVDSYQLSFKLNQLIFHDIMSVASNRLSSDFLNKMLNFEESAVKQMSDTSSEQQPDTQIIYRKNQNNAEDNFINQKQEIQQINDYMNLKYNRLEMQYSNKCMKKKDKVIRQLELRKDLVCKTVKDIQLHKQISTIVKQQFIGFVNMTDDPKASNTEADRLVRQNKISKTKNQSIKLKTLIETLAAKNRHQEVLQEKFEKNIKPKSSSRSPISKKK